MVSSLTGLSHRRIMRQDVTLLFVLFQIMTAPPYIGASESVVER